MLALTKCENLYLTKMLQKDSIKFLSFILNAWEKEENMNIIYNNRMYSKHISKRIFENLVVFEIKIQFVSYTCNLFINTVIEKETWLNISFQAHLSITLNV